MRRVLTDDRNNRARRRFDGIWDPKKIDEMEWSKGERKSVSSSFWMRSPLFFIFDIISLLLLDDDDFDETTDTHIDDTD